MSLKLQRPIICFDLETTGKEVVSARICSISIIKEYPDGTIEKKSRLVNPTIVIPQDAIDVHGITNEMVANELTFKNTSRKLLEFMSGCDLLTYNGNNFDIPILAEEFLRCEINFPEEGTRFIDAFSIFLKESPRTLTAAYKNYCNKELEDAHNSEADTNATYEVFKKQLEVHESLQGKTIDEIHDYCSSNEKRADLAGKILIDEDGDYIYNIGDDKGKKVKNNIGFANWMLGKNFTMQTKNVLSRILEEIQNAK